MSTLKRQKMLRGFGDPGSVVVLYRCITLDTTIF